MIKTITMPTAAGAPEPRERVASGTFTGSDAPGIVINSSPTIVLHDAQPGVDMEAEVLEALRRHAGELYDQWRREAERRRRTEF